MIDTLEWARLKWFNMSSFALGVVANEVGITLKDAHRAIHDTRANAKFFIKMLSHLRGEGTQKSNYKRRKFKMNF
jgi:DNA polymerase III alpha subunit (gram-positive type)